MKKRILSLVFFLFAASSMLTAQEDVTMSLCTNHLKPPYVSDGQQYRALISTEEMAEFRATFYGGSTYRIVACSGNQDGQLIFTLYDSERNELFSSRDHQNAPYWDFRFINTVDCIIEAQLSPTAPASGFAILQIGFLR